MTPAGIRGEMESGADAAASFDPLRPLLTRVAYRMLGSVADAEDVVQDAFIRWLGTDRDAVREPAAFLRRTVTRLCLDLMKSARRKRETYVGAWLPEPLIEVIGVRSSWETLATKSRRMVSSRRSFVTSFMTTRAPTLRALPS